ncbi:hypothetical protein EVAR_11314_1 [Eumeta japonica]|uniref:DUF5641 domain-containing protein n=1 Tax=Eumeta variegata TaxID=151549 RepID=A0A4C1U1I8_EUMVA|nr:hypothetical protein EVAR_11314_1 [Eumeta japonica]
MAAEGRRGVVNDAKLNMYQRVIKIKQRFWKQFYCSYLSELQTRSKWLQTKENLRIGDSVIGKDEVTPPNSWPLGKSKDKRAGEPTASRWSLPPITYTRHPRGVSSALPASWVGKEYLMEGRVVLWREVLMEG